MIYPLFEHLILRSNNEYKNCQICCYFAWILSPEITLNVLVRVNRQCLYFASLVLKLENENGTFPSCTSFLSNIYHILYILEITRWSPFGILSVNISNARDLPRAFTG